MESDPTTKTSSCVKDNRSFYYLKNKVEFLSKTFLWNYELHRAIYVYYVYEWLKILNTKLNVFKT